MVSLDRDMGGTTALRRYTTEEGTMIAAAMALSSVSVITNALRLRTQRLA